MEKEEKIILEDLENGFLAKEDSNEPDNVGNVMEEIPEKLIVESIFKDPEKIFNNGMSSLKQEKLQEAIQCFDEVIKLDPQYADVWFYKGEALEKCDEFEKAMKYFDEAIKVRKL